MLANRFLRTLFLTLATVAMLVTSGGCSKSLTIESEFPPPLIEPINLKVGVRYPEIRADYVETDESPSRAEWDIVLANANMRMFDTLFAGMFTEVRLIDHPEEPSANTSTDKLEPDFSVPFAELHDADGNAVFISDTSGLNAIIEPVLEDLEVSMPAQSGTELYGVWLKYTLRVYSPEGELITAWPVTGIGQVGKNSLTAAGPVRAAAIMAMRDAAANIVIGFSNEPMLKRRVLPAAKRQDNAGNSDE